MKGERRSLFERTAGLSGLAISRPKEQIWPFFKSVGFEIFENLLSSWLF